MKLNKINKELIKKRRLFKKALISGYLFPKTHIISSEVNSQPVFNERDMTVYDPYLNANENNEENSIQIKY